LLVELHPTAEVACGVAPRKTTQHCLIRMVKIKSTVLLSIIKKLFILLNMIFLHNEN